MGGLSPIEQNYQYGAFGALTGGRKVGMRPVQTQPQPVERTGGVESGIAKIKGEITPNLGATGSSYTTGLGHSEHNKLNLLF